MVKGKSCPLGNPSNTIYVFEFKLMGSGTPQDAIKQIIDRCDSKIDFRDFILLPFDYIKK